MVIHPYLFIHVPVYLNIYFLISLPAYLLTQVCAQTGMLVRKYIGTLLHWYDYPFLPVSAGRFVRIFLSISFYPSLSFCTATEVPTCIMTLQKNFFTAPHFFRFRAATISGTGLAASGTNRHEIWVWLTFYLCTG